MNKKIKIIYNFIIEIKLKFIHILYLISDL
jgi:hypothetical protein